MNPGVHPPARPDTTPSQPILYQPFWCEENIWHLAQHPDVVGCEGRVVVITGGARQVACWHQRAGNADGFVVWDYHVVLATAGPTWSIWDLDSRLGYPVPWQVWLLTTFPIQDRVPPPFQPLFSTFPARRWVQDFHSDRSHMRRQGGGWQQPLPPWPPITAGNMTWGEILDRAHQGMDLASFAQLWTTSNPAT